MTLLDIPFSQAFAHVTTTTSWWVCAIIGQIIAAALTYFTIKNSQDKGWKAGHSAGLFLAIAIAALSIVYRPGEISVNTSPEQAARGVFIGY